MTITEFLLARIAEDEAAAEQLTHVFHGSGTQMYVSEAWIQSPLKKGRFLSECAARRAIMSEHEIDLGMAEPYCDSCAEWWNCELGEGPPRVKYPCPSIRALATIYADHPDYRQEWAA